MVNNSSLLTRQKRIERGWWWRASAYRIRDGEIIEAEPGATIKRFDISFDELLDAALEIVEICDAVWPMPTGSATDIPWAPASSVLSRLLPWVARYGLLGVGLHDVVRARLWPRLQKHKRFGHLEPPVPDTRPRERIGRVPVAVLHGAQREYIREGGGWATLVADGHDLDLGVPGNWLPADGSDPLRPTPDVMWRFHLGEPERRAAGDVVTEKEDHFGRPYEPAEVVKIENRQEKRVPIEKAWAPFFPVIEDEWRRLPRKAFAIRSMNGGVLHLDGPSIGLDEYKRQWPYPHPESDEWWLRYTESASTMLDAVQALRVAARGLANEPTLPAWTELDKRKVTNGLQALKKLTALDERGFYVDHDGRLQQMFESSSMLGALAGALAENLLGDRAARACAWHKCKRLFAPKVATERYCHRKHRDAANMENLRARKHKAGALQKAGRSTTDIAVELGISLETVDAWCREARILELHAQQWTLPQIARAVGLGSRTDRVFDVLNSSGRKRGLTASPAKKKRRR